MPRIRLFATVLTAALVLLLASASIASANTSAIPMSKLSTMPVQRVIAAHAASVVSTKPKILVVNVVTPRFKSAVTLCGSAEGRSLCKVFAKPAERGYGYEFVCLSGCRGRSRATTTYSGGVLTLTEHPALKLRAGAIFALLLQAPNHIGRFRLYKVVNPDSYYAALKGEGTGCTAANYMESPKYFESGRPLPIVPCSQSVPPGEVIFLPPGSYELSNTVESYLSLVAGADKNVKPHESFSIFISRSRCLANSLLEALYTGQHKSWNNLNFNDFYETVHLTAAIGRGWICAYAQLGKSFDGLPAGRVAAIAQQPFWSGDSLTGPGNQAVTDTSVTTAYSGQPATKDAFWIVADSSLSCPDDALELEAEIGDGTATVVKNTGVLGEFSYSAAIDPPATSEFQCGYLDEGAPTGWDEADNLVAMTSSTLSVGGAPVAGATFPETVATATSPDSNPLGALGPSPNPLAVGQSVAVRCYVYGFSYPVPDGSSSEWLEVSSPPWSDAYYAPAGAFQQEGYVTGLPHCGED